MTDDRRHEARQSPGVIRIKNWKKFQNYKFRNPPWIRLYGDLLDPEETPWYRGLTDTGARFLFELWLLARRDKGVVPYDTLMILRDLHRPTSDKPLLDSALAELASVGAITLAGTDASAAFLNMLAHRVTESQSPTRDTEKSKTTPSAAPSANQPANWVAPFCEAWQQRFGGTAPGGRIGKAFKPLREKYPDDEIMRRWQLYLTQPAGKWVNPEDFAQKFGEYDGSKPIPGTNRLDPLPGESVDGYLHRVTDGRI